MVKIGLEIHQRVKGHKLFCNCPGVQDDKIDGIFKRFLYPTFSEHGKIDIAAIFEKNKNKIYTYQYNHKTSCLVEMDEEPPHEINKHALTVALSIAIQMNMRLIDKPIVMRKIVIDGSNTSGFQRTVLLGVDGHINNIPIQTLCLEEESAGIVNENDNEKTYRIDRLGIPLIEIATAPIIKSGKEAKEIALEIGKMLRATNQMARGIGTIRQDLNVSIENGARVEIKGAQELNMIEKWVDNEIKRQKILLDIIEELKKRNAYEQLTFKPIDVSECVGKPAYAVELPGFEGLLGKEVSPNRRFGSELADYARKAGVKGLIHSDEDLSKYGIDISCIKKKLNNAFMIVFGKNAIKALELAFQRAKMDYIPEETRKALPNGSTSFMRPISSSARMYPETDLDFVDINSVLEKSEEMAKKGYFYKKELLYKLLNKEMAERMILCKYLNIFEKMYKTIDPKILSTFLCDHIRYLKRKDIHPNEKQILEALNLFKNNYITKKALPIALELIVKGERLDSIKKIEKDELIKIVREIKDIKEIMKRYGVRVDAKEVKEILSNLP